MGFLRPTKKKILALVLLAAPFLFSNWCLANHVPYELGLSAIELGFRPASILCDNEFMNSIASLRVAAGAPLLLLLPRQQSIPESVVLSSTILVVNALYVLLSLFVQGISGKNTRHHTD